jgi:hypothetical protein
MSTSSVADFAGGIYASSTPPTSTRATQQRAPPSSRTTTTSSSTVSFKDTVELFATKNGVLFMPTQKIDPASGKPLLRFGKATIYLDGTLIFAQDGKTSTFYPVSFDRLLEMQR